MRDVRAQLLWTHNFYTCSIVQYPIIKFEGVLHMYGQFAWLRWGYARSLVGKWSDLTDTMMVGLGEEEFVDGWGVRSQNNSNDTWVFEIR